MRTGSISRDVSPVIVVPDSGETVEEYRVGLSDAEWRQVETLHDEKRQRHFKFGRIAARLAIVQVLGPDTQHSEIKVLSAKNGAPLVLVNGQAEIVSVSLSHSGRVAAACAWRIKQPAGFSVGVDVERLRSSDVATSPYAFSRRERAMLSHLPIDQSHAGIVAWSVKEAMWKALRPSPSCGPESIEIRALDLNNGCADVQVKYGLVRRLGSARIRARFFIIAGPNQKYVLSCAITIPVNISTDAIDAITNIRPLLSRPPELNLFADEMIQATITPDIRVI
jgi:phosphopantetheinyl transferase